MPSAVIILTCVGIVGVIAGVSASRANDRFSKQGAAPPAWPTLLRIGRVFGIVVGVSTWPLTYWMGYPIATPDGIGRIVGIPFMVAFFDSRGHDYIGLMTILGVIGNGVFWFLVPDGLLFAYGRFWRKRHQVSDDSPGTPGN